MLKEYWSCMFSVFSEAKKKAIFGFPCWVGKN